MIRVDDVRIKSLKPLISPAELKEMFPVTEEISGHVASSRSKIEDIISGRDNRLLALVGPCSIHDIEAGLDYARRLKKLSDEISDRIFVVMRIYFEKPRTRLGWRGLILDPYLDGSYDIEEGLKRARSFLSDVAKMKLPAGSEMLDPIIPQYIADLTCWAAIGARTTESQTHREMASGLSMPVGYKNSTDGSIETAMNAMASSKQSHSFIGIDQQGRTCVLETTGNESGHIILRGGRGGPNYYIEAVEDAVEMLENAGLNQTIMIDCSHANSRKQYLKQIRVLEAVVDMKLRGINSIVGFMLESNLKEGRQDIGDKQEDLEYGVSVTDACISWDTTERVLLRTYEELGRREK